MPDFTQRAQIPELLDGSGIPFSAIKLNMEELDQINSLLGGHRVTLSGLRQVLEKFKLQTNVTLRICEVGCGGGDNLRVVRQWLQKEGIACELTGIDINPECISFAQQQKANEGIRFLRSDYREVHFEEKPDVIFTSLFCHHFPEAELIGMVQWLQKNSRLGF